MIFYNPLDENIHLNFNWKIELTASLLPHCIHYTLSTRNIHINIFCSIIKYSIKSESGHRAVSIFNWFDSIVSSIWYWNEICTHNFIIQPINYLNLNFPISKLSLLLFEIYSQKTRTKRAWKDWFCYKGLLIAIREA